MQVLCVGNVKFFAVQNKNTDFKRYVFPVTAAFIEIVD
jgi:hypothetical protein